MLRSAFHIDTPDEEYEKIRERGEQFMAYLRRHPASPNEDEPVPFEWLVEYGERYALSITEMAEALRLEHGIRRSKQAISKRLTNAGYDTRPESLNRARLIPWVLRKPEHREQQLHRFLLTEARLRDGSTHLVDGTSAERHARVMGQLSARNEVVDYSPEVGFRAVARRPGIDLDIIREPGSDQSG